MFFTFATGGIISISGCAAGCHSNKEPEVKFSVYRGELPLFADFPRSPRGDEMGAGFILQWILTS